MSLSERRNRLARRSNCVAIWVGKIETVVALDEYLYFQFPLDFEVVPDEENQPEIVASSQLKPFTEIIRGFSQSRIFLDDAVAEAAHNGVLAAHCAVVYYYTHFDDDAFEHRVDSPLLFLGNIGWQPSL